MPRKKKELQGEALFNKRKRALAAIERTIRVLEADREREYWRLRGENHDPDALQYRMDGFNRRKELLLGQWREIRLLTPPFTTWDPLTGIYIMHPVNKSNEHHLWESMNLRILKGRNRYGRKRATNDSQASKA